MKKYILTFSVLLFTLTVHSQNWTSVGQGLNKKVFTLFTDTVSNFLYAGGDFDSSGTAQLNHIGFWDGVQWNALGAGFNNRVRALTIFNGELFAAGDFTYSDTTSLNYIAKWSGTSWVNVGGGLNANGLVLFNFNGNLYAGGNFTIAGSQPCKYIAKWDGLSWQSLDTNIISTNPGWSVMSISSFQNELVIGGNFTANGTANNISILSSGVWQPLSSGTNSFVTSMGEMNNELIVTGYFNQAGSVGTIGIAKWNGTTWLAFPTSPTSSLVECNAIVNNNLVFGGYFNSFLNGNISSRCIANFNLTNQNWSGITTGMTYSVNGLATIGNTLYAGGSFDTAGTSPIKNIAKIDASTLSTENILADNNIRIFPNPFSTQTTLQTDNFFHNATLTVYNSFGQTVKQIKNISGQTITLFRDNLPSGLYFLRLTEDNKTFYTDKLVITD